MLWSKKTRLRPEIRNNRSEKLLQRFRDPDRMVSIGITVAFAVVAISIVLLREQVVSYRPGQFVPHDIVSRVRFVFNDKVKHDDAQRLASEQAPRVYVANGDLWTEIREKLIALPEMASGLTTPAELPPPLNEIFDTGSLTTLHQYKSDPAGYRKAVDAYVESLRKLNPIILADADRKKDLSRYIVVRPATEPIRTELQTYSETVPDELRNRLQKPAQTEFSLALYPKILNYTIHLLRPTHLLDERETAKARHLAAEAVPASFGETTFEPNTVIVTAGRIGDRDWELLRAENDQYIRAFRQGAWTTRLGVAAMVGLITVVLAAYIARFQPKVIRNHARAIAIAALLLSMLLLAQLAAIGSSSLYLFGVAPTILVAMILTIAYDQRFALGVASMHALLVTVGLDQNAGFFLILWVGVLTACFLLDDIRTRSKLIEVSGATALAMIAATAAYGAVTLDPIKFIAHNCLYTGAAGLAVGFVVLGILPFIEKAFRITTSMTLLELADASHPLLRRLQMEAPGTYNHSLQVATLSEAAAEMIGGNSLLCRVASYYHDVGKINKSEYFIENQLGGHNRHINLSPSVSLLIIIGHVKDGIELAKEYNLPTSVFPFIQQHHGTTLVEYFYHQACTSKDQDQPAISEMQYRYPGPKPRSREVAVVMLADAVESACRAMGDPTASRIESLVHDLAMKRLLDGQFDECDLTMRELETIERSLVKSLLGIYHGRIAYPPSSNIGSAGPGAAAAPSTALPIGSTSVKTA